MLLACACGAKPWSSHLEDPLPSSLSKTGIFANLETLDPAPSMLAYTPAWPLYSDGADKRRLLALPEGTTIDASWTFPVGTLLVKTFTFDDLAGRAAASPVETRLLFRRRVGWHYAVYQWNEAGTDATLVDGDWNEVPLHLEREGGESFLYVLPSRLDCRACHETSQQRTGNPVLGIGPHQLSAELATNGAFAEAPRVMPVKGRTDAETAALGYFVGNCISCHHGGAGSNASFSLYPEDAVEQTVGRPVQSEVAEGVRVVPGDGDASALFVAVTQARSAGRRARSTPMPPIGVTKSDPEAAPILRRWIDELAVPK